MARLKTWLAVLAVAALIGTPIFGASVGVTPLIVAISTGVSGLGTNVATWLATPSSANLAAALTDETGTAGAVFANTPTLVAPVLGAATATSVNFGGTTLSTYTESTFTPGMTFGGSATGVTFSTQTGSYTRIGNRVCFEVSIVLTSNGSGTGVPLVTNLPFTADATISTAVSVYPVSGFVALTAGVAAEVTANTTTIAMRAPSTTGTAALSDTNVTDTATFRAAGCYHV